jgi:hypothetical protein
MDEANIKYYTEVASGRKECKICRKKIQKGVKCVRVLSSIAYGNKRYMLICPACLIELAANTEAKKYITKKGIAIAVANKI